MISLVYLLADGRPTPEIEEWVFHELPFSRALLYRHAHYANDQWVWTVSLEQAIADPAVAAQVEDLVARIPVDTDE